MIDPVADAGHSTSVFNGDIMTGESGLQHTEELGRERGIIIDIFDRGKRVRG